jgi:hypothetical protein
VRGQGFLFADLAGGLDSKDAPYDVPEGAARDLLNVVSTAKGAIRKRDGSVQFAAVDASSLAATFQPKNLIAATGTKLQKITGAAAISDIKTGLTNGLPWEWVEAPVSGGLGPAWGMNGTDTPQAFDGGAGTVNWTASAGTVPNGKYMVFQGNRVWVAVGSRVYWCEIGDPRNWPAANVTAFDENDGGDITGLGKVGPYVLVFKEKKTWVITDLDTSANRKLSDAIGCVSHRSVAETPNGAFFLAQPGIFRTDGNTIERVSLPVDPTLAAVSVAQRRNVAGGYFNDHYYLSFARGGSDPDRTLDFDFKIGSWWLHSLAARQWTVWEPTTGLELLGAFPSRVSRAFVPGGTWSDAGAAYSGGAFWASTFHAFGMPALRKRVKRVSFDGSGIIQPEVAKDFAPGTTFEEKVVDFPDTASDGLYGVDDGSLYGVDDGTIYGGLSTVSEARLASLGVARAWSVKFGNQTTDPFEVDSYTLFIGPRKD